MKEKLKELMKFNQFAHLDMSKLDLDALDEHEFDQLIAKAIEDEKKIENFLESIKNRNIKNEEPAIASFMVDIFKIYWSECILSPKFFDEYETGGLSYDRLYVCDFMDRSYKVREAKQLSNGELIHQFHIQLTGCIQIYSAGEYLMRNKESFPQILNDNSEIILGYQKKKREGGIFSISLLKQGSAFVLKENSLKENHNTKEKVFLLQ